MVALSISAASVAYVSGPKAIDQIAGEAFSAGDMVYLAANGKWLKAQGDGTAIEAGSLGTAMALGTADAANARVTLALPGAIVSVGTGTAGVVYTLAPVTGDLDPVADNVSTEKVTPSALGIGSSKLLLMRTYNAGSVLA